MNSRVDRLLSTRPASVATAKRSGGGGSNMPAAGVDVCKMGFADWFSWPAVCKHPVHGQGLGRWSGLAYTAEHATDHVHWCHAFECQLACRYHALNATAVWQPARSTSVHHPLSPPAARSTHGTACTSAECLAASA